MPIWDNYRHYFNIDPDFFPAVNEAVIKKNPGVWKKFYPHETFVTLLKNVVSVLNRKQKQSIWVEGAYGTGKSHAVLTLIKLLDASMQDTKEYFERYKLDMDLFKNLQRVKDSGKILAVHRYGSSNIHGDNDLVLAIQESVEKALAAAGIENTGNESLRESVIRYLSDSENKQSFNVYVRGSYRDLFGGDDVDGIVEKLKVYRDESLHTLMEKVFKVARERQIRAFTMTTKDLCDWIIEVIHSNNLKAIVFVWDEFKEYFDNNTRHLTGFQEICELSETEPFYFVIVTHVSSGLFHEGDKDFKKLNDRFVKPHSLINLPEGIAFQLMGAAMEKNKDAQVLEDWRDIVDDLADRTQHCRRIVANAVKAKDNDLMEILPIHPYTALLLKHISYVFDSNQRSMFDFIKNDTGDEGKGFQWFIDNVGPEYDNPFLTIDMLWEFFYDKGRDLLSYDVRAMLDYYNRNSGKKLDPEERRVLKTVLLLQAISQHAAESVDLFIPNQENIDLAFEGTELQGGIIQFAERLVRDKVLFHKELGGGKFYYAAYINEISEAELEKFKDEIDARSTTSLINEPLADKTTVSDAITLGGALKPRYELRPVSASDFDQVIRTLRNRETEFENRIPAVVCFAKDDKESTLISKKIQEALQDRSFHIVFIDATTTPFGKDGYEQYRNEMANSMYQQDKDPSLAGQYSKNAKESLKKWKERISGGEYIVFSERNPDGERATTLDGLYAILRAINREAFPCCLEATYSSVQQTMFTPSALKQGVECGATRTTRQTFSSSNVNTKLETAFKEAWNDPEYWKTHPNLLISQIKLEVDQMIHSAFKESGRVSIRSIYDRLKAKPYGFMPCNLTAFVMGFVLKEYIDGTYSWSDGLTNDVLDLNKLKEMVNEIITLQITPNLRYKEKYIVEMTEAEKAFNETTSYAFGIPLNLCTSVEQTRERIRSKMKEFSFPIWTIKSVIPRLELKTSRAVLEEMIDNYCGIANSNNLGKAKSESSIALSIGELSIKHPEAKEDLRSLLTKDYCTKGMIIYVQEEFENGELTTLAEKIGDNGQFINALRSKFDADAANWVWNMETAQQKIREVILEYRIIEKSNTVIPKNITFASTVREWCDKCGLIRVSFVAAKNHLGSLAEFLSILLTVKRTGTIQDSQKQKFYDLLVAHADEFRMFYSDQIDLFKKVCEYYLDGLTDEDVRAVYQMIPAGTFTYDKSEYMNLVDAKVKEYRSTLGTERLKKLWKDKTGSDSPAQWSKEHLMPILCLVPDNEVQAAKAAFEVLNRGRSDASAIEKAIEYLENADFYNLLRNQDALDCAFRERIIKSYAVMLTDLFEVKSYLKKKIFAEPYDWFGLPEVDKKLEQMAEDKYNREGCTRALEKIDNMDVDEVKRYLKELIRDNMIVGMEIIKGN